MASREMLIIILVLATTLCGLTVATDHVIGGPSGWNVGASLRTWSGAQTFAVGDNLVFSYPSAFHNVLEVTKPEFDSCQAVKPLITFADGNSIVPLTTPGKRYFICGMPGHCSQGMKLEVNVLPTTAATATSPTAPLPNAVPSLNAPSPSSILPIQPLLPLNPVPVLSPSSSTPLPSSPLPSSSLPLIPAVSPALSPAAVVGTSLPLFPGSPGSSSTTSTKTVGAFPSTTTGATADLSGAGTSPVDSSAAKTLVLGFGFMIAMILHLF